MRRRSQYALICALVLAVTAGVAGAGFAVDNPYLSTITRTLSGPYSNQLTATVTRNDVDNSYHYLYELVYTNSYNNSTLSSFTLGNPLKRVSWGWGCSETSLQLGTIIDGLGHITDSVLWNSGTVPVGRTVKFWYDSFAPFAEVDVSLSGGRQSKGFTLGMMPEPGSLLTLAFGLGGVLWAKLRRRS